MQHRMIQAERVNGLLTPPKEPVGDFGWRERHQGPNPQSRHSIHADHPMNVHIGHQRHVGMTSRAPSNVKSASSGPFSYGLNTIDLGPWNSQESQISFWNP